MKRIMRIDYHPRVKLMLKNRDNVAADLDFSIKFVSGDKDHLSFDEFREFHRNMFWVQPKENVTHFCKMVCEIWGFKA